VTACPEGGSVSSTPEAVPGARFPRITGLHRLLVNQAGTFLGDALLIAAFPLLAVHVTRSPALISAVGASATLPWVVVGLPSGLAAARRERGRLLA
jgi:hypothetical protein